MLFISNIVYHSSNISIHQHEYKKESLRENCPNTPQISVFSPNAGKYAPGKTPHLDNFHAGILSCIPAELCKGFEKEKKFFYYQLMVTFMCSVCSDENPYIQGCC